MFIFLSNRCHKKGVMERKRSSSEIIIPTLRHPKISSRTSSLVVCFSLHFLLQLRKKLNSSYDSAIRHKNIVEVYAACTDVNNLFIVMEYMKNGSLTDYLREVNTQLPEAWPSLYRIAIDIVRAMMHLHSSSNRIHRDLKPANILV